MIVWHFRLPWFTGLPPGVTEPGADGHEQSARMACKRRRDDMKVCTTTGEKEKGRTGMKLSSTTGVRPSPTW